MTKEVMFFAACFHFYSLPEAAGEGSEIKLRLLTSPGVSLVALEGYASAEVRKTYSRA